jgi:catechol 2,3-dioxygenase-like lactoylglutathione lyase family enzyme
MALLNGIHHLTTLTTDMDRLIAFYAEILDARVLIDMEEEGLRHAFIELGPHTVLHPFQVHGVEVPRQPLPMFGRGRIDHVALHAASEEGFRELHRRVVAAGAGASEGVVTDMGSLLLFTVTDPDGAELEVVWLKPGVPVDATLAREEWRTVPME